MKERCFTNAQRNVTTKQKIHTGGGDQNVCAYEGAKGKGSNWKKTITQKSKKKKNKP